ncbi:MAG TPA: hypothetical protein VJR50_08795 [Mycobacterium sp.]|nr:hypothetical protein [Mycobacterium sp.]
MGFRDDIRRLKDIQRANPQMSSREIQSALEAEKQEASDNRYADAFAATNVDPYVESFEPKVWKSGGLIALVKNYIRIVGLQPEDVFGMFSEPDGERGPLMIVYRDRPEYAEGRRRFHSVVGGAEYRRL